jgi:hypothetical protein
MKRSVASATGLAGAATAEFVAMTLPGVPLPAEPGGLLLSHVIVDGFVNYSTGTLTTAVTLRVRRASLVGTLVGVAQVLTTTASTTYSIPFSVDDPLIAATPPTIPGQIYVVTLQQTSTGAAGTVNYSVATATTS